MKWKKICYICLAAGILVLGICGKTFFRDREETMPEAFGQETAEPEKPGLAPSRQEMTEPETIKAKEEDHSWDEAVPPYAGKTSVLIYDGNPLFTEDDMTTDVFRQYSELDEMGRSGAAFANVCRETMPVEEREGIGSIRPTGWHTVKYEIIADRYLYNRCHLIGYQLAGDNAQERNLITGTRYMNVEGMLPWENKVASYVEETGNHVLYRATPCFEGGNLVASGVRLEAYSVEDNGAGICFHVYCYNVQPGILIDYATGESCLDDSWTAPDIQADFTYDYVLNKNTKKFHVPSCESVQDMSEKNKEYFAGDRQEAIGNGYSPCGRCNP